VRSRLPQYNGVNLSAAISSEISPILGCPAVSESQRVSALVAYGGNLSTCVELVIIQSKASFSEVKPSIRRSWPW
jgi:hypothetical protein